MEVIDHLMLQQTHDERIKYEEYLQKIEELKTEMESLYILHPSNYITKENRNDFVRDCDVPFYLCRNRETLVIDSWDEKRIDTIGSNGDGFPDRSHYGEL